METLEQTAKEAQRPVLVKHKKRGRPAKLAVNGAAAPPAIPPENDSKPDLPGVNGKPDHSLVPQPPKRLLEAKELMQYWQSIPEPERSAWFIAYVYRKYPICDIYQPFSKEEILAFNQNKGRKRFPFQGRMLERPDSNCGTLAQPFDPENWEQAIYERWGAGDYQIRLNDQHPSVHDTVTECHVRGLRDWDRYAPVLDVKQVVLGEELNQPYLRWARLRGIKFPGDPEMEAAEEQAYQENEEMATVVETMARHNEALTDKVVEMADRARLQPAAPSVDPSARGQVGAVETVVEGAKQAMGVMGSAMKQIMDNQAKASDPSEQLKHTIEIAKLLVPAGNGNSDMVKMMELQLTAQREQSKLALEQQEKSFTRLLDMQRDQHKETIEMLKLRIDSLEKQRSETPASSDERALDTYFRIRDKILEQEPEESSGPGWLGPVLGFGEKIVAGIAESTRNIAAIRAQQSPPTVVAEQALPAPDAPKPPSPQDKEMEMLRGYAQQIHRPLVDAIKAGTPGHDFAAALIQNAGQQSYDFLEKGGYDGTVRFLQCYQPLWEELMLPPIGGIALEKFLREFLDREKTMEAYKLMTAKPPATARRGPVVNN